MAGLAIVRTCASAMAQGEPVFIVYLAGGAWVTFGAARWPEPSLWVIEGKQGPEDVSVHTWRAPTAAELALLDATPAGRSWRARVEGGRS